MRSTPSVTRQRRPTPDGITEPAIAGLLNQRGWVKWTNMNGISGSRRSAEWGRVSDR
jgi:hypothetical protein